MYKHFIRTNASGEVCAAFSDAFQEPEEGDICITPDGTEERHFNLSLMEGQANRYTWDGTQLVERSEAELVSVPTVLSAEKERLCDQVESRKDPLMRKGFPFSGGVIQADAEAQSNLSAWVLLEMKGAMTYPRRWRKLDNTFLSISNANELNDLSMAMAAYKDSVYSSVFDVKDAIRAAGSVAEAQALFDAWTSAYPL